LESMEGTETPPASKGKATESLDTAEHPTTDDGSEKRKKDTKEEAFRHWRLPRSEKSAQLDKDPSDWERLQGRDPLGVRRTKAGKVMRGKSRI